MANNKEIRFNVADVVKYLKVSTQETNEIVKIVKSSKLMDRKVTNTIVLCMDHMQAIFNKLNDIIISVVKHTNEINESKLNNSVKIYQVLINSVKYIVSYGNLLLEQLSNYNTTVDLLASKCDEVISKHKNIFKIVPKLLISAHIIKFIMVSFLNVVSRTISIITIPITLVRLNILNKVLSVLVTTLDLFNNVLNKFNEINLLNYTILKIKRVNRLLYGRRLKDGSTSIISIMRGSNIFSPFLQIGPIEMVIILFRFEIMKIILIETLLMYKIFTNILNIITKPNYLIKIIKISSFNKLAKRFIKSINRFTLLISVINKSRIIKSMLTLGYINLMMLMFISSISIFVALATKSIILIVVNTVIVFTIIPFLYTLKLLVRILSNFGIIKTTKATLNILLIRILITNLSILINEIGDAFSVKNIIALILFPVVALLTTIAIGLLKVLIKVISKINTKQLISSIIKITFLNVFLAGLCLMMVQLTIISNPAFLITIPLAITTLLLMNIVFLSIMLLQFVISKMPIKTIIMSTIIILLITLQFKLIKDMLLNVLIATAISILIPFIALVKLMGVILMLSLFMVAIGSIFLIAGAPLLIGLGLFTLNLLIFTVALTLILVVAGELAVISKMNIKKFVPQAKENVLELMSAVNDIIQILCSGVDKPKGNPILNKFRFIKNMIFGNNIIELILSFGRLIIVFVTLIIVILVATQLKLLSKMNVNEWKETAINNVKKLFETVNEIISIITTPNETNEDNSKRGLIRTILNFVSPELSNLFGSLVMLPLLITTIISVGMITLISVMLRKISTIELDPTVINDKLNTIIGTVKNITKMINGTYETERKKDEGGILSKVKGFFKGTIGGAIDVLSNIGATGVLVTLMPSILMLNTVVDLIKGIQEIKLDENEQTNITNKVGEIIRTAKLVSKTVTEDENVITLDPKKVRQFGNFVDDSIKYFKHINTLDVSKVKSLGDMYDKMGQFMDKLQDAPIADIADALVNKISPALSDINESMNKKQTSTTTTQSNTFGTGSIQMPQPATQNINVSQQTPQVDYSAMLENIEDLLEQIKQKLNINQQLAF